MTGEEEVAQLRAENQKLREGQSQALEQLSQALEQLRVALARIAELEKLKTPEASFVKANVKKPPPKRKHRARNVRPSTTMAVPDQRRCT